MTNEWTYDCLLVGDAGTRNHGRVKELEAKINNLQAALDEALVTIEDIGLEGYAHTIRSKYKLHSEAP